MVITCSQCGGTIGLCSGLGFRALPHQMGPLNSAMIPKGHAEVSCVLDHSHALDIIFDGLLSKNILSHISGHITIMNANLYLPVRIDEKRTITGAMELNLANATPSFQTGGHLGVLLHELLAGLPPSYDDRADEIRKSSVHAHRSPLAIGPLLSRPGVNSSKPATVSRWRL